MENITTGHWIFAGIFAIVFIGYLVWSYRKDIHLHKTYYRGASLFLFALIMLLFIIFIFKRLF